MDPVSLEPFLLGRHDARTLAGLVECYRDVFAEPPWNEWLACSVAGCGASWGTTDAPELAAARYAHCGQPVADYWPRATVVGELLAALGHGAVCWIAIERSATGAERVVGFTWGSPLASAWPEFEPELQESLRRAFGEGVAEDPTIVYQTEVGVIATHRNRGLARRLTERRNRDFLERGFRVGVTKVRETPEPSVTFRWYAKLGFRVVHRFPSDNGRVVLARDLEPGLFDRVP